MLFESPGDQVHIGLVLTSVPIVIKMHLYMLAVDPSPFEASIMDIPVEDSTASTEPCPLSKLNELSLLGMN